MKNNFGIGFDTHKLVNKGDLIIGGVLIDTKHSLEGDSDGDVLIHSIIDSILGAVGVGDIGLFFPSHDIKYKNISSLELLTETMNILNTHSYKIINSDSTIILERHASPDPSKLSTVSTPLPASIDAPVKLKPTTVVGLEDTVNPAASAAPPDVPVIETPDTLNWNP